MKKVESNGSKLTKLLQSVVNVDPDCLSRALIAATRNDNPCNMGKVIIKGASNIEQCIDKAIAEGKPHSQAMLLLVKAAITGSKNKTGYIYWARESP